jgi:hypothetical protein
MTDFISGEMDPISGHGGSQLTGSDPFKFIAPGRKQASKTLLKATLEAWDANLDHILIAHSDPVASVAQGETLYFRHELAREAILETISPPRRARLHVRALDALRTLPEGRLDAAPLAHHAEGAGDRRAILHYAPTAATQAAAATAHREAATLYALAVGCADELAPSERAMLLEAYSWECNMIDQRSDAIGARRQAVALWDTIGNHLKEGENLARLVPMLIGVGHTADADRCSRASGTPGAFLRRGSRIPRGAILTYSAGTCSPGSRSR